MSVHTREMWHSTRCTTEASLACGYPVIHMLRVERWERPVFLDPGRRGVDRQRITFFGSQRCDAGKSACGREGGARELGLQDNEAETTGEILRVVLKKRAALWPVLPRRSPFRPTLPHSWYRRKISQINPRRRRYPSGRQDVPPCSTKSPVGFLFLRCKQ